MHNINHLKIKLKMAAFMAAIFDLPDLNEQ
jgi:hypothetical protein